MPKVPNTGLMQDDAESAGGPRVGQDDEFDPVPLEKKSKDEDASVTGEPGADPDAVASPGAATHPRGDR